MQTLQQLLSGELKGTSTLRLSCNLTEFPKEIFELADTLEILDLSNNHLSRLPANFGNLKKLKIAFFSDNDFTELPVVLANCPALTMISFKFNKITVVPETAFPVNLQWLILTNNCIEQLPASIGNCHQLQKVALAGNKLRNLPETLSNCTNLELLRISANHLTEFPDWLLSLPKLTWLAYAGNPCCKERLVVSELSEVLWKDLAVSEILGEGASGIIYKAGWNDNGNKKEIAVKVFKGEVTSDGFSKDEINTYSLAGQHKNIVSVTGKIMGHPEEKPGLAFELIPSSYKNLGNPPSYETCTRDTFKKGTTFSAEVILTILIFIANAMEHLHAKGIMHGDLYAHNILTDEKANTILGDFGAATIYDWSSKNADALERLDVRAFGCLTDDLLNLVNDKAAANLKNALMKLKEGCMNELISERPSFNQIKDYLSALNSELFIVQAVKA